MILDCYNVLKMIERRPEMFVGENTLKAIYTYISGYNQALIDEGIKAIEFGDPFFDWVANRLGYYESTAGWVNMIVAVSMGFEAKDIIWEDVFDTPISVEHHSISINLFYELLEDYRLETITQSEKK